MLLLLVDHDKINSADRWAGVALRARNTQNVQLRGPGKRLDEVLLDLTDSVSKIRCDKLSSISEEALKCSGLMSFLEKIIIEKKLLCKLSKRETEGMYLVYFADYSGFTELEDFFLSYYTTITIDFANNTEFINTSKWSEFKNKNLISNQDLIWSLVNSRELVMFGKKECLFELENKIQEFLEQNKPSSSNTISLILPQLDVIKNLKDYL